jgi:hypothetical protein
VGVLTAAAGSIGADHRAAVERRGGQARQLVSCCSACLRLVQGLALGIHKGGRLRGAEAGGDLLAGVAEASQPPCAHVLRGAGGQSEGAGPMGP